MTIKEILSTRWGKLLVSGISIIIIATLSNFFQEDSTMYSVLGLLFAASLMYPIYFTIISLYYTTRNLFKTK